MSLPAALPSRERRLCAGAARRRSPGLPPWDRWGTPSSRRLRAAGACVYRTFLSDAGGRKGILAGGAGQRSPSTRSATSWSRRWPRQRRDVIASASKRSTDSARPASGQNGPTLGSASSVAPHSVSAVADLGIVGEALRLGHQRAVRARNLRRGRRSRRRRRGSRRRGRSAMDRRSWSPREARRGRRRR